MSELSFIEKLLDGVEVEWQSLGEIATITIGEFVHKDKQNPSAQFPVFNGGTSNTGYYDKFNNTGDKIIVSARGANAGFVNRISKPYWAGNSCYSIGIKNSEELNWKYVFYFLKNSENKLIGDQQKGGIPAVSKKQMEVFQIPIPCPDNPKKSLKIQAEIVRILDAFTTYTAELTAELNLRKQQYNHYRDQLLSFEDGEVEWKTLGEIGHIVTGRTPKSSDTSAWGDEVDFVTPSDIKNGMRSIICPSRRLSAEGAASMSKVLIPSGSLLVTCIGADMGKTVINANDCIPNQQINAIILTDESAQVSYLFHILTALRDTLRRQGEAGGGTMPLVNKSDFSKVVVPIPSPEEQTRILAILDKFDALTNSTSEGLPREIELRQQQYEYYRDLLLSFPKSNVEVMT